MLWKKLIQIYQLLVFATFVATYFYGHVVLDTTAQNHGIRTIASQPVVIARAVLR